MIMWNRSIARSATFFLCPLALTAQARLDVSTGELRFRGAPGNGAVIVAPQVAATGLGLKVWADGQFALANAGNTRSSLQSVLTTRKAVLLGLSPVITVRGQDDPFGGPVRSRRADGALGVSIGSTRFGAGAGVGVARSVHSGTSRAIQTANADVHLARGAFQMRVGYVGNAFDAPSAMTVTGGGFSLVRTRLSDVTSDASWRYRGVEVGGFVGRRVGGHDARDRQWGGGWASIALTDRIAIVARQESAPSDPTRHLAAQRLSTIGFRIRPSFTRARFDDGTDAGQFRREFVVARVSGTSHGVRVYLPDAKQVELAGSFNDWTPATMQRVGGGWWELTVPLASGMHSMNVRADGGKWIVPPGLDVVSDEFNGTVGVLLIP
jgi:Carbohydrate-binding module 48 (Isoamylase N-terminal domain)